LIRLPNQELGLIFRDISHSDEGQVIAGIGAFPEETVGNETNADTVNEERSEGQG
jgi:hypothetical protein